jgi:hypothetical protein
MRTAADLAAAIPGGVVKESTIQNVEAGRKAELTISQLLNIALALRLPPGYLLAPMGNPHGRLDLPNLSDDFMSMTVAEFDAWISGDAMGAYRVTSTDEHRDRNLLQAMRELETQQREQIRLRRAQQVEIELSPVKSDNGSARLRDENRMRIAEADRRVAELSAYLRSAGWDIAQGTT